MPPSCQLHLPKYNIFKSALLITTESINHFHLTSLSFFFHVIIFLPKHSSNLHYITTQNPLSPQWFTLIKQCANKVMSDSPGLVDFAIGVVYSALNLSKKQLDFFFWHSNYRKTVISFDHYLFCGEGARGR